MKYSIIFLSLFCFTIPSYSDDDAEKPPVEENDSQEVALLEPAPFAQLLLSPDPSDLTPPVLVPRYKSSFLTVGLSSLIPGLGHAYLGDYKTAAGLFGASNLLLGLSSFDLLDEFYLVPSILILQNTWSYGIYAAYRDVRAFNNEGVAYDYKMPTDSFTDLALAPFRWSVLKKKEVWGGFLGALALGAGLSYLISAKKDLYVNLSSEMSTVPFLAFPVGIGEEALFRGYLQSQISELSNPLFGIVFSSLAFGAIHIPNALLIEKEHKWRYYTFSVPFITALGAYFGLITYKSGSLQESVALHSWYDFFIFLSQYSLSQSAAIRKPCFAFSFSF